MYAPNTYVASPGQTQFDLTFSYRSRPSVQVLVDGVDSAFTWVNATRVQLTTPCVGGEQVEVVRVTDVGTPEVDFENTSVILKEDLNADSLQALHRLQEIEVEQGKFIRTPPGVDGFTLDPEPDQFIAWNEDGTAFRNVDVPPVADLENIRVATETLRDEAEDARDAAIAATSSKANRDGSNLTGGEPTSFRNAIGAVAKDGTGLTGDQPALVRNAINAAERITDHKARPAIAPYLMNLRGQGLKLRKALSDIRTGARSALRIMVIGDSLSGTTWADVHIQLMRVLEGHMNSTPVYAHSLGVLDYGNNSTAAAQSAYPRNYTGTIQEKIAYDVAWDGTIMVLGAGQASNYSSGGLAITSDFIHIPIIKEPGAGVVKVELSSAATPPALGGSWTNPTAPQIVSSHTLTGSELLVNADGTFGLDVVKLSLPLGTWTVKTTQVSGGTVRTRFPMHEVRTAAAFNVWRVGSASNDFASAQTSAATIEAAQIAAYNPDIIVVESDDRVAAYQNFLPKLETAVNSSGLTHKPLVLLVVNPYYLNGSYTDADIIARADYCYTFAGPRLGWDVLDGMAVSGGLAEATAAGWNVDNIHYHEWLAYWMTYHWAGDRGYLPTRDIAGGAATNDTILTLPRSRSAGSARYLTGASIPALLLQSAAFDTAVSTWAAAVTGSGSFTANNDGSKTLATGGTGSSGVGAYINVNGTMLGSNQGNIRGESRGFAVRVRTTTSWDAQAQAYILVRTNDVAWNSAYNGTLVGQGYGFRITNDGTNTIIQGICWLNGALVVSSSSATMPTGAASGVKDLAVVCIPETVNSVRGTLYWYVAGALIGTSNYDHGGVFLAPRVELTNGSTATNRNLMFMPFKFMSGPT